MYELYFDKTIFKNESNHSHLNLLILLSFPKAFS